jgi:hypothetical protein
LVIYLEEPGIDEERLVKPNKERVIKEKQIKHREKLLLNEMAL